MAMRLVVLKHIVKISPLSSKESHSNGVAVLRHFAQATMTRQLSRLFLVLISWTFIITPCLAWSPNSFSAIGSRSDGDLQRVFPKKQIDSATEEFGPATRRAFLSATALSIAMISATPAVLAATTDAAATVYRSGKTPKVPDAKPKDKSDLKGTRKDPDFLRSVADCRSQCQNTPGSDGYARSKEDCLSECQDICCKTYEQCTFDIVPRI